jgi:hypothetical protein
MELFLGCYDFTGEYLRRVVETLELKEKSQDPSMQPY